MFYGDASAVKIVGNTQLMMRECQLSRSWTMSCPTFGSAPSGIVRQHEVELVRQLVALPFVAPVDVEQHRAVCDGPVSP